MPTFAVKASVLDGSAEVVAYTRDSSNFFLRVRVPEKAGCKSRRIDVVETLDAAVDAALETYVQIGSVDQPSKSCRGTQQGMKIVSRRRGVFTWLDQFLDEQSEQCEVDIIKRVTLKNKRVKMIAFWDKSR